MITRIALTAMAAALTLVIFYVSRFWDFRWWDRPGLFGLEALPPQGGLVGRWLRGTDFAAFELLIWGAGVVLVLSAVQWLVDRIGVRRSEGD